jgi:hypothetical protein
VPDESDQPASKGCHHACQLARIGRGALPDDINSDQGRTTTYAPRSAGQQRVQCRRADDEGICGIESGYNPKATTGKYKCLFQLSDWEFAKYWHGDIYDIRDCSIAAARKVATEAAQFEKDVGRRATAAEIYCIHQQGYQGCAFHYAVPYQLAWKNMYLTAEGQEKGEAWARKAIWGNVPSDLKNKFEGGVEALTSGQFIALWTERVASFMARNIEPPADYVQHAKKPTQLAVTNNKKTKVAATDKKKKKTKVASSLYTFSEASL